MLSSRTLPTLVLLACVQAMAAGAQPPDAAAIEQATGLKGTYDPTEHVFKVTKPRDDVKVTVDGAAMSPFSGLTSYAAFMPSGKESLLMGDTVLFEDEVNPAMSAALDAGLEVTALHNHFFFDVPKVYFMHIGGHGDPRKLGAGVKAVYDRVGQIRAATPTPAAGFSGEVPSPSSITPGPIAQALGGKVDSKDGMVKVTIGRETHMHGAVMGNQMGVNTWAAFMGSDDHAAVDGDFAMTEGQLQAVLKSMRADGINIVAIHQHMTYEQPRIVFLHYWGKGKAIDLAHAVRHALDAQQKAGR